jgi:hypothetical protein
MSLIDHALSTLKANRTNSITVSSLQKYVIATIRRLNLEYEAEAVDARSGYSIDLLVNGNIAVEVDGPSHFIGGSRAPNGATLLKRRHLELLGYSVVPVPYWEWDALSQCGQDRRRREEDYVIKLLGIGRS